MNKLLLQKRGQKGLSSKMTALIGAVILIFLIVALAPEIYTQLNASDFTSNAPGWVPTIMVVMVSAGLVFLVWRTFSK